MRSSQLPIILKEKCISSYGSYDYYSWCIKFPSSQCFYYLNIQSPYEQALFCTAEDLQVTVDDDLLIMVNLL